MNSEREDAGITISNYCLNSLPKLPNDIRMLTADNNNLTSLTNVPKNLRFLSMSKNKIAFLGNLESEGQNLLYLNLSFNRLISLEGISACASLQTLLISNNYVGDDQILHIQHLKELRILDISHNHLRDKHFLNVLSSLNQLEELQNAANDFSEWKIQAPLRKLKKMVLDSNKIRKLEILSDLPELKQLSIRENNVSTIVGVRKSLALEELDLSGNDLNEIPDEFSQLKNLKKLSIKNNSLTTLPKIQSLTYLDASYNTLISVLNLSESIQVLLLSHNNISELPILPNIITCDLSFNKLTNIAGLQAGWNLESLNLNQNLFQSLETILKSLKPHKKLKTLNIENIDLSPDLISNLSSQFPYLETLNNQQFSSYHQSNTSQKAWDSLSKSKLFPSCRSSLAEIDKNICRSNEFSIFSDIKLDSSVTSMKPDDFGQDTEYRLLAKELEINTRIQKLDIQTKHLGDSLISNKSQKKVEKQQTDFNNSLISRKSSARSEKNSIQYLASSPYTRASEYSKSPNSYLATPSNPTRPTDMSLSKYPEKEDSTISFEISESKLKEPRKFISDGLKDKKSKCCKNCCKKRRKSINLQTSIKNVSKHFIDQATSPMHSLMKLPINNEKTIKSTQNTEKSPSAYSNRSYFTDVPGSANRNRSFIDDKEVETRVLQYKRSNTPLSSYRNPLPRPKIPENLQLINYATTPPRPILASESKNPILCTLNPNGTEFFLLSQIFQSENKTIKEVIKTYTYFLQKQIQNSRPEIFLNKAENKNFFLFFKANFVELENICNSPEGFSAVLGGKIEEIVVFKELKEALAGYGGNFVMVAISNLKGLGCSKDGRFLVDQNSVIVPVYLVEYCN